MPKDEFTDNGHVPYEMYVRETRRLVGRHVYTEHDNSLAKNYGRTPIHGDSVAVTDWYMDSHSCTTETRPGYKYDGKLILTEESRPGQIPYQALLPQDVDNLLVPLCMSTTHIAWGAVRLEPVWMQTGEAAGFAAALAHEKKTSPGKLSGDELTRLLCERRQLVSFFNDFATSASEEWVPAVQYLGTKGFFADYDAKPNEPMSVDLALLWWSGFESLRKDNHDADALATRIGKLPVKGDGSFVTANAFAKKLELRNPDAFDAKQPLTRGAAALMIYDALGKK
ncbi:MAG: FAD-dependent oxidoreductase [Pirellulales bacterium]